MMRTSRTAASTIISRLGCMSRARGVEMGGGKLAPCRRRYVPKWILTDYHGQDMWNERQVRYFASDDHDDDKNKKGIVSSDFIRESSFSSLTGVGQVIFLNSPKAGAILLGSLAIGGDPIIPILAAMGALTSTVTAQQTFLSSSREKETTAAAPISSGLLQYNGVLVGCASAVFCPTAVGAVLATLTGATAATMTTAAMSQMLAKDGGGIPQFTWAFNFVTLTMLCRIKPFTTNDATAATTTAVADSTITTTITAAPTVFELVTSPLTGLSQIFLVQSPWSGLGVAAAIASYSPALAMHAIMGSTVGGISALAMYGTTASSVDIAAGLFGFNSALTSMGVGVFCVDNWRARVLSVAGAAATAAVFAGLREVFAVHSVPCLTLPFCITMTACYYLVDAVPGLHYADSPHSPEKNKKGE